MTLDEIVGAVRSIAGDRDSAAYRYNVPQIVAVMVEARRTLSVRKVANMSQFTITTLEGEEAISPEPSESQGIILAFATAQRILQQTYRERLDQGTLGVSWRSGLEEESTINQERAYRNMLDELSTELKELVLIFNAQLSATRPQ